MSSLPVFKGWRSRGYLPHFEGGIIPQAITFRLADSLPAEKLTQWREELAHLPKNREDVEYRQRLEEYLDRGTGCAWLRRVDIAGLVENALFHFDEERYRLHAWVVMPNHVHVLFTPEEDHSLSAILHSWKSFTSQRANRLLERRGDFWQAEYYDRFIRDEPHFQAAVDYIEDNPVKAGIGATREEWPFSSARLRPAVR